VRPRHAWTGRTALAFLAFAAGSSAAAEAPRLVVGAPVAVSADRSAAPHVEPHLAADPDDPEVLLGAAVTFPEGSPERSLAETVVAGFRSADGGALWRRVALPACRIDPWVAFGKGGLAFVQCLGEGGSVIYRSEDAGRSWEEPVRLPAGEGSSADRPVLTVDDSTGPRAGTVYAAAGMSFPALGLRRRVYGPAVSRSEDGGRSFQVPVFLRHDNLAQQPFAAGVLSDSTYFALFMDYLLGSEPLHRRRTWLARSTDGGRSFSTPALVLEQREAEMPWSAAVDRSARHRDRIIAAVDGFWKRDGAVPEELRRSGQVPLFVTFSDDGGESWSAPVAVSDAPGTNAETPAVAVSPDGVVAVAWYDTRHDPSARCFDLYVSASLDGGATFLPNARVSPETSCPGASEVQQGVAARWRFGGDYSGLAAGADGRIHLLWADSRTGVYQIWAASVSLEP
jgi:hypothetical protein